MPGAEQFDASYPDFPSTLYPLAETAGAQVLRNTAGVRNGPRLQRLENALAGAARVDILRGTIPIDKTFDLAHARQLHAALFSELYPNWAGVVRPHGMVKGDHAFAPPNQIKQYWRNATEAIRNSDLPSLPREDFVSTVAYVYANINQAHFGREGNGRTGKLFLDQVAAQSAFTLNYALIDQGLWNGQSSRSGPATGYLAVHPANLVAMFDQVTVDRAEPASAVDPVPRVSREASAAR